jgi:hypothetical protein
MQIFWRLHLQMQLILRRCGCGVGGVGRNAARSIHAYLSRVNRKMLHVEKIEKLLYILI